MKSSRRFIPFIILGVIAIAVVFGMGLYALHTVSNPTVSSLATSTSTYRNDLYGFEVSYPNNWEIDEHPEQPYLVTFNPAPSSLHDVIKPKIWVWQTVPKYGAVATIGELKDAITKQYASQTDNPGLSVVEKGGFTFVVADGIPGIAGESSAFTIIPQGVLGIYASDSILDRISKITEILNNQASNADTISADFQSPLILSDTAVLSGHVPHGVTQMCIAAASGEAAVPATMDNGVIPQAPFTFKECNGVTIADAGVWTAVVRASNGDFVFAPGTYTLALYDEPSGGLLTSGRLDVEATQSTAMPISGTDRGTIKGSIGYPSSCTPSQTVCAINMHDASLFCSAPTNAGCAEDNVNVSFSFQVPAGTYYVYAMAPGKGNKKLILTGMSPAAKQLPVQRVV